MPLQTFNVQFAKTILHLIFMKNRSFICLFSLMLCLAARGQVLPVLGGQRVGLSTLSFLKNDLSPQSIAMGGASAALEANPYSVNNNPGALALHGSKQLALSNAVLGAGVHQSYISWIKPAKNGASWALTVNSLNTGLMEVRTEFMPQGTGEKFGTHFSYLGFSYSKRLSSKFSVGGTIKYVFENLAGATNQTATGDLGFLYDLGVRDLKFAVLFQNFGGNSSIELDDLPNNFNRDDYSLSQSTVPTTFKMGFSFNVLKKGYHKIISAFQLNHPNDNSENYRIGFEYQYSSLLFIRAGYRMALKAQNLPTFGLALQSRLGKHPLKIDYSVLPSVGLGTQHLIGLALNFNEKKRNE